VVAIRWDAAPIEVAAYFSGGFLDGFEAIETA
jgi:hypothetical protein